MFVSGKVMSFHLKMSIGFMYAMYAVNNLTHYSTIGNKKFTVTCSIVPAVPPEQLAMNECGYWWVSNTLQVTWLTHDTSTHTHTHTPAYFSWPSSAIFVVFLQLCRRSKRRSWSRLHISNNSTYSPSTSLIPSLVGLDPISWGVSAEWASCFRNTVSSSSRSHQGCKAEELFSGSGMPVRWWRL